MRKLYKANDDREKPVFSAFPHFGAEISTLVAAFFLDMEATKVAQLTGLNRNSVNLYFGHFRQRLAQLCETESPLRGEVEIDKVILADAASGANGDGELLRKCPS